MARKRRSNPLALVILALLFERPMHPYEMASTLRYRNKHRSIRLNYGSLYTVVEQLERDGFIAAGETVREGRRPERTTYSLTDAGRIELDDWLRNLVSTPVKEYPQIETALSLLPVLPPADAIRLLRERLGNLDAAIADDRASLVKAVTTVERLFLIEDEFAVAMLEAEREWIGRLVAELESGSFPGVEGWAAIHPSKGGAMD